MKTNEEKFRACGQTSEASFAKNSALLKFGLIGTIIIALCCFTPILVVLLGAVGLAALSGYLDYVLFPALAIFVGIVIYAFIKQGKHHEQD